MTTSVSDALLNQLNTGLTAQKEKARTTTGLDQNAFLTMMIAQMKNQDPTKPMDSTQYLSQLAQFSTVTGIQQLQATVKEMTQSIQSQQAVAGADLVGRNVLVDSASGWFSGQQTLSGLVHLDRAVSSLSVGIVNSEGRQVRRLEFGAQASGDVALEWDGRNSAGVEQTPGLYRVTAEGIADGKAVSFTTSMVLPVQSVSLGDAATGMSVNLPGAGAVAIDNVKQIF